ncbi:DinB family protein [Leeuwenhoekiella sp. NPDC079379]|uniref:DinB family protein n=1 Tax=Leeuwenhoekiella sp. NPDC079379 TaxID=3364122 RepID=UPI0037C842BA
MPFTFEYTLDISRKNRQIFKGFLETISLENLNKIPAGFNNNIIWNIAHVIATQQVLVYLLSGIKPRVSSDFIDMYRKGTKPERDVSQEELVEICELLSTTIDHTATDYAAGIFKEFNVYTVSTGSTLNNVDDALAFNNFHEGIHLGSVLALRHAIGLV